jgi:hypothetical protein
MTWVSDFSVQDGGPLDPPELRCKLCRADATPPGRQYDLDLDVLVIAASEHRKVCLRTPRLGNPPAITFADIESRRG